MTRPSMTPTSLRAPLAMPTAARLSIAFTLAAALGACGGGDDGPTATVTSTNVVSSRRSPSFVWYDRFTAIRRSVTALPPAV